MLDGGGGGTELRRMRTAGSVPRPKLSQPETDERDEIRGVKSVEVGGVGACDRRMR
jgi:hypothetical protein